LKSMSTSRTKRANCVMSVTCILSIITVGSNWNLLISFFELSSVLFWISSVLLRRVNLAKLI
jgi:hypothetical protein